MSVASHAKQFTTIAPTCRGHRISIQNCLESSCRDEGPFAHLLILYHRLKESVETTSINYLKAVLWLSGSCGSVCDRWYIRHHWYFLNSGCCITWLVTCCGWYKRWYSLLWWPYHDSFWVLPKTP